MFWTLFYILASLTAASEGTTYTVTLTPGGVASYSSSNPLVVNISDTITFTCNGSISNVIILASQQQWQSCNATTGGAPFQAGYCVTATGTITLNIVQQSNMVANTFSFNMGQDYYLASFSDGTLTGAYYGVTSGGECLSGVKMVIRVPGSSPTTSSSSSSSSTSSQNTAGTMAPTNSLTTLSASSGGTTSESRPSNMTLPDTASNTGSTMPTVAAVVSVVIVVAIIGGGVLLVVLILFVIRGQRRSAVKDGQLNTEQSPNASLTSNKSLTLRSDIVLLTPDGCKEMTSVTSDTCKEMTSITSDIALLAADGRGY